MIGRRLSHYVIEERLGAGGMGEVYRARDEKLGRDVALKVLPPHALGDEEARRRFRKEAVVLSRLSHPHIATLLDFDSADGIDFLVMELVLGPTLEQELRQGPLAEKDVLRLGSQLARGLVAAHEQGVVHRDLKPSNLQLTADGMLKILDFGVARLERAASSRSGTETATETSPGDVIGSPPYMAPEQLLGRPVDARTDVYAVGACLYEMATGRRPYGEKHGAALTEAILHEAVAPPRSVNGAPSAGLESVILKCLDKEPGLRYQTAKELAVDLERLQASTTAGAASQPVATAVKPMHRGPWLVAVALLVVATAAVWLARQSAPARLIDVRPITSGLDSTTMVSYLGHLSWTTDGNRLYFVSMKHGRSALLQVPVTGGEPVEMTLPFDFKRAVFGYAAEQSAILMGGSDEAESSIAVSPQGWPLWMVPVGGGAPRRVGNLRAVEAALSRDGVWLALGQPGRILVARSDGTAVRPLAQVPAFSGGLRWSPDGRRLRYTNAAPDGGSGARGAWVWELDLAGGAPRALWPGSAGDWSSDGRYYFLLRPSIGGRMDVWAVREGAWLPWLRNRPVRLTLGPLGFYGVGPSPLSRRLYAWGMSFRGEMQRLDPASGRPAPYLGGLSAADLAVSADGRWLAWVAFPEATLWRSRADGSDRLQLTVPPLSVNLPRFSPDGARIVFVGHTPEEDGNSIRVVSVNGGEPEILAGPSEQVATWWDTCWLPDGRSVVSSSAFPRQPGLFRIDVKTRKVAPLAGAERLQWPLCRWQGGILAREPPRPGSLGRRTMWVYSPDRGTVTSVSELDLVYPNWTLDGKAFVGLDLNARQAKLVWLDTRRVETVADVSGMPLEGLTATPWMGLAQDDAPLVLRSHDTRELYALDWEAP